MMRGIFFRHVLREVALATLAVGAVLLAVLVTYQVAFVLGRAADGQLPAAQVPALVLLSLRSNVNVILPLAVLLGIVAGLGRLYYDNEIAAAQACGVPATTLLTAAGFVIGVATLLAAWSAFVDGPKAARAIFELRSAALRTAATRALAPGTFRALGRGMTLYFRASDGAGSLQEVFVQRDLPGTDDKPARLQLLLAGEAHYRLAPDGAAWLVDLGAGRSYEGVPGAGDWRITAFTAQQLRIPLPRANLPAKARISALGNHELLAAPEPRLRAELHWRIAWVLEVIVLGLAAVPLARLLPRQGRYARVPWAVLLFAVYAGLVTAGRSMLEHRDLPLAAGLWWAHAAALAVGAALWWRQQPRTPRAAPTRP